MSDTFDTIKVEPERDRFGRYLIHPAKGGKPKAHIRATTIADTLDDRYNLELWKVRMGALGLVERPDLYASIASLPKDDKSKIDALCAKAIEAAKGSAGANLGTALHRFTERINRGEEVRVPAPWDADIAAYQKALAASGYRIRPDYLERIVVLDELGVAGMFDMLLEDVNGNLIVADLKTGANLDFSWCAISVQEALYSRAATLYDPATKTHEAMPAVDQETALVIHLPAGKATCTLYEVDIAAGWEAAQHALWTRNWRKRKNLAVPATQVGGGEPSTPPGTVTPAVDVGGGEPAPGTPLTVEPAPPADGTPFEGGPADPVAITELREKFEALTVKQRAWIGGIYKQAHHIGASLSMQINPTQRNYWIGCGILDLANGHTDMIEAAIHVAGYIPPRDAPGETLATLNVEEAALFAFAAEQLANGGALIYQNDGTVSVKAA